MKLLFCLVQCLLSGVIFCQTDTKPAYLEKGEIGIAPELIAKTKLAKHPVGLFIQIRIDGKPYQFLLDTGASISVLDKSVFTQQEKAQETIDVSDLFGSVTQEEVFYKDFKIENIDFTNFAFVSKDLSIFKKDLCGSFSGIIGANVLKKLNWKYTRKDEQIYFSKIPFQSGGYYPPVSVQWAGTVPLVQLDINGNMQFPAIIDTGHFGTLIISNSVVKSNIGNFRRFTKGVGDVLKTYTGLQKNLTRRASIKHFTLGELRLQKYEVVLQPTLSNIGNGLLVERGFIFNFLQNQISVGNSTEPSPYEQISKMKICEVEGTTNQLEVCFFWDEKPYNKLKLHDKVIKINDIETKELQSSSYCDIQRMVSKGIQNITVLRDEKVIDINLN